MTMTPPLPGLEFKSRYFVLHAGGNRDALFLMHKELNLPGSVIKKLRDNPLDKTPDIERWLWASPDFFCRTNFPLEEVEKFIEHNGDIIKIMSQYREKVSLIFSVNWMFLKGAHGFYISHNLMNNLAAAGFSLEIDIIEGSDDISRN